MKKLILLSGMFLLFVAGNVYSQATFGIRAGLNLANVSIDPKPSNTPKPIIGFHIGGLCEYMINESFGIEADALISMKGAKNESTYTQIVSYIPMVTMDVTQKSTLHLFYLDIPIMGKYLFNAGAMKVYVQAGPNIGLGLSGSSKNETSSSASSTTDTQTIKWGSSSTDDMKRLDLGLIVGAGIQMNKIMAGINYTMGLTNLCPLSGITEKNNVFQLTFGYKFGK